jgi:hypothetical protein
LDLKKIPWAEAMPEHPSLMRSPAFALIFMAMLWGAASLPPPLRADDTTPEAKQRKQLTGALRKGRGSWYAIQLLRTTYSNGGVRSVVVTRMVRGRPIVRKLDEVTDKRVLVPTAKYEVVEGLEPAVDLIIKHIGPPMLKKTKSHRVADEEPPEETSWNLLGRYLTREEADAQVDLARQAFDAEPHWRVPDEKRGRRARLQP